MTRLPSIKSLTPDTSGWAFYLCVAKEVRPGKNGEFISLTLQDATGRITSRIFDDVEHLKGEFETGEFVKVQGRSSTYNGKLQLIVERIRRVNPDQDRLQGFREDDCVMSAPRPVEDMWAELTGLVAGIEDPHIGALVRTIVREHEAKLRVWPAAQTVHHAYRGGFLEHVLQIARVAGTLAQLYGASRDIVVAGALLHDIGKLQELNYETATTYTREGNLVGHIVLGLVMVRQAAASVPGFPPGLLTQIEHIIVSHHGSQEFGSPVEPMTVEAFILSMADDLDAKIHQIRQAIQDDTGDGEFTGYHSRLGRMLFKGVK